MSVDYASSWTVIANRALSRLGQSSITSLDDGSGTAKYCSQFIPEAVLSVLGQYDWKAHRKRVVLAPLAEAPAFGYDYAFQLPPDFVRVVSVECDEGYSLEGQTILTDSDEVNLVYIATISDPVKIPGHIQHLIITYLAFLLSTPLTSNEAIAGRISQEFMMALERAKTDDERASQTDDNATWYDEERG
jgi:hypothetical protein